jgi:hypothetical protein
VEAPDEATAKKAAMSIRVHRSDWEIDTYSRIEDIDVESVEPA